MKPYEDWTRAEFEALPVRKWNEDIGLVQSIIILPTENMHDSGYRCMDFVAIQESEPTYRLSGCSDVLHIGGIINEKIQHFSIDCLPVSGLLRLFSARRKLLVIGDSLSDFDIYESE